MKIQLPGTEEQERQFHFHYQPAFETRDKKKNGIIYLYYRILLQ